MQELKIITYLEGKLSSDEEKEIESWILASDQNTKKFNLIKAKHIALTLGQAKSGIDTDRAYTLFSKNTRSNCEYAKLWPVLKYAAVLVVVLGATYFYLGNQPTENMFAPGNAVTLELDDGNIKVIAEDGDTQLIDSQGNLVGTQKGTQLVYKKEAQVEELTFNVLTVPYGKRFDIVLSDGTHVFLNSGTSLKYPVKFLKGKKRIVFLDGEAYFDVAKDVNHPFIVRTDELQVQALGTQFNVSSYGEDDFINTSLVEGSVAVYGNEETYNASTSSVLEPGYKAKWNKGDQQISIKEVDVELCTAWLNDKVVFRHMKFQEIIKKLERHYDVEIINQNQQLANELFTASFDIETIEQIFKTFNKSYGIQYTITDDKIIIN